MTHLVENRKDFWFIVSEDSQHELAVVFDHEVTAREICVKVNQQYPWFKNMPKVAYGTAYPRPDRVYPKPFPHKVKI